MVAAPAAAGRVTTMREECIRAHRAAHPWLPEDYVRILARVEPGERRYGLTWLDGPQAPGQVGGPVAAGHFPQAWWIGRRNGQAVGYERRPDGTPELCEWGRSQRQVLRRYAGIDALILAQIDPSSDRRPVVAHTLEVPGLAFSGWRVAGNDYTADCLFSAGREAEALERLLAGQPVDWEIVLTRPDGDSWLCVRRQHGTLERLVAHHGSIGDWQPTTESAARRELGALAPGNDGARGFARFSVPGFRHIGPPNDLLEKQ